MPPQLNSINKKLHSPNALIADLQSEVMRLRLDNAALRRERDALDVRKAANAQQAEEIAQHLKQLAERAADVAASMQGIAVAAPPSTAGGSESSNSAIEPCKDEAQVAALQSQLTSSLLAAPTTDVLLQSAARLDMVKARLVPPLRGSYLVELWKRRDGPSWQKPLHRSDLPSRAFWSAAELERLACALSDAYDEHGQPAWGLLAPFQKAADGGKGGSGVGDADSAKATAAAMAPSAAAAAEPAAAGALHIFAGEPLDLATSKAG